MSNDTHQPGKGLLGWLGRQVGYVTKAVKTDVTKSPVLPTSQLLHRNVTVVENALPGSPEILLRRTTIDEAMTTTPAPTTKVL